MTTSPTCIIAYTSEEDRFPEVVKAACNTAAAAEARLVFYDIDASSPFAKPLPTDWSAEGAKDQVPLELSADDLERAGRHHIALQVRNAREQGIDAYGWLPGDNSGEALADYAHRVGADLILIPEELQDPGLFEKLRGKTLENVEKHVDRPLALVHSDGRVEAVA